MNYGTPRAIPTRVGKSFAHRSSRSGCSGHPHAGGEIHGMHGRTAGGHGPSPRGWGNLSGVLHRDLPGRAIPTRVGKSRIRAETNSRAAGHPHAGGEIAFVHPHDECNRGPSPRGWGNQRMPRSPMSFPRAIPTRVGKSLSIRTVTALYSGHPHAGGEIAPLHPQREWFVGPSPRGWGNLVAGVDQNPVVRAIPTRVGKSINRDSIDILSPGHPHAGGEIFGFEKCVLRMRGPSPRGWGNPMQIFQTQNAARAIPTRVGKSRV